MTAPTPQDAPRPKLAERFGRSLSAKLIALVAVCVLFAESLVLVPSIAKQRIDWLNERVEAAWLVGLALDSPRGEMITPEEVKELFDTANIRGVSIERYGARMLVLAPEVDPATSPIRHFVNLGEGAPPRRIAAAWAALFSEGDDLIRVTGRAKYASEGHVDILVSEAALRRDLGVYARNILGLSLVITTIVGLLVYALLIAMIVRPVRRLTGNMMAFETNPEDPANVMRPSARSDEIGVAERSLAALERRTQSLLSERRRLAALGAGVSKISHDLRNILASAQLMSDRLANSEDPRVRKLSPRLIASLDRAIALSRDTLSFARMEPASLKRAPVDLRTLADDVFDDAASLHVAFDNDVPDGLVIEADPTHFYRALSNIVRNAVEAMTPAAPDASGAEPIPGASAGRVAISADRAGAMTRIRVSDTGPGIPQTARDHLFEPFKGSLKPGGSGLGVAIAAEIARAHGGRLILEKSDDAGTVFLFEIPDRSV